MAGLCDRCMTREARSASDLYCDECEREIDRGRTVTHPRDFLPYANQPHCDQCGGFGTAHRSLWQCSIEVVGYTGPKGPGGITPANYGEIDATLCADCQEKVTHYRPKYHEDVRVRAVKRVRLIQGKPEEWEAEGRHVVNST